MKTHHIFSAVLAISGLFAGNNVFAQDKTILSEVKTDKEYATFGATAQKAELSGLLSGNGEYTVFAPSDKDLKKAVSGISRTDKLREVVTYLVVPGKIDSKTLERDINDGHGRAVLTSLQGGKLWAMKENGKIVIRDEQGSKLSITDSDKYMKNGVIHEINGVAMQKR